MKKHIKKTLIIFSCALFFWACAGQLWAASDSEEITRQDELTDGFQSVSDVSDRPTPATPPAIDDSAQFAAASRNFIEENVTKKGAVDALTVAFALYGAYKFASNLGNYVYNTLRDKYIYHVKYGNWDYADLTLAIAIPLNVFFAGNYIYNNI